MRSLIAAGSSADHRRGQERHQQADDESPIIRFGKHAERNPPQFDEIDRDNGENRTELNQYGETVPEIALAKVEKSFRQ